MVIPVVLIGAAKLEEVCTLNPRHIVTDHMVLSVPEPGTDALGVQVVGSKHLVSYFAKRFDRSTQSWHLWRLSFGSAGPIVPQEAVVELVGDIVSDVCCETRG